MEQNIIRLDGIEATSIIDTSPGNLNGELTSTFRLQQSLEAIQEFRVDSSSYPAEMGTGTGGQVSFITKSGSNYVHGSVFEYLRNDFLDARNTFNRCNTANNTAKFRLNQFSGSIGGRIFKDKLFGFANYEGLRQVYAAPYAEATLSNYTKSLIPATSSVYPLLAAFPSDPFLLAAGVLQRNVTVVGNNKISEDFGAIRFDYHIDDCFQMYARYYRVQGIAGPSPNVDLSRASIAITGLTNPTGLIKLSNSFNGRGAPYTGQTFSYIDNLSFVQGNHTMKFGVEIRPVSLTTISLAGLLIPTTPSTPSLQTLQTRSNFSVTLAI